MNELDKLDENMQSIYKMLSLVICLVYKSGNVTKGNFMTFAEATWDEIGKTNDK